MIIIIWRGLDATLSIIMPVEFYKHIIPAINLLLEEWTVFAEGSSLVLHAPLDTNSLPLSPCYRRGQVMSLLGQACAILTLPTLPAAPLLLDGCGTCPWGMEGPG